MRRSGHSLPLAYNLNSWQKHFFIVTTGYLKEKTMLRHIAGCAASCLSSALVSVSLYVKWTDAHTVTETVNPVKWRYSKVLLAANECSAVEALNKQTGVIQMSFNILLANMLQFYKEQGNPQPSGPVGNIFYAGPWKRTELADPLKWPPVGPGSPVPIQFELSQKLQS